MPTVRIRMVEVRPVILVLRGDHTQKMTDAGRVAALLLTQGPGQADKAAIVGAAETPCARRLVAGRRWQSMSCRNLGGK